MEFFEGNKIEILEMSLKNSNNQLELFWKIYFNNTVFITSFYNVSRFRIEELSLPLELQGLEIIKHLQNGWEQDLKYEIRDFENDQVGFFCEYYKIEKEETK